MWPWTRRTEEDFREEIQAHIALDADRFIADGMSAEAARRAAQRAFGNMARAEERFYESRRVVWVDNTLRDVRFALRMFIRQPMFTLAAIVSLALGVGATTAAFSAIDGLLLHPYPYAGADRLVVLAHADGPKPYIRTGITTDDARVLAMTSSLDAVVLWDEFWMWTKDHGVPD